MLKFISFGSGSSGNCYLLCADDNILMIDAGIDLRKLRTYFDNYGINATHIHNLLLTHDHIDHVKAAGAISQTWHIDVHATSKVHNAIDNNRRLSAKINTPHVHHIRHNIPFDLGAFHITPFDVPHDSHTNTGYRIEYEGSVFCLVTDIGHITPTIIEHLQGVEHLVVEANYDPQMLLHGRYPYFLKQRITGPTGHLSNNETARLIGECCSAKLRNVWLCHLSEENNTPETALTTVKDMLQNNAFQKYPNMTIRALYRQKPTGFFEIFNF